MIYLSIVIPAYNSENTIIPLLESIVSSQKIKFKEIEIIVVDDMSSDDTVGEIIYFLSGLSYQQVKGPSLKLIKLKKNQGPAHARNVGVKYAKGEVVLFLDADVIVYKNTLFEIVKSFKKDPDLFALTGVWDKEQFSRHFFPKFKALRDWSYWINERDPKNYYYLFSTRIAAIKRDLFLRLGGFDETYKAALVEDMELTYRIARRYAVVFNPKAVVHHEFEDFWPIGKKYFLRSFYWSRIYRERKRFDPVATTGKEALTTISAGGIIFFMSVFLLSHLGNLGNLERISLIGMGAAGVIHLWGVRKFLWFCFKEEGAIFSLRAFFAGIILYLIILTGAAASFLPQVLLSFPRLNRGNPED